MSEYKPYVNDETGERLTLDEAETAGVELRHDPYPEGYSTNAEGSNYTGYGDDPGWSETVRVMYAYMGDKADVLEAGCANGWFVAEAAKVFKSAVGIDISEYATSHPAPSLNGDAQSGGMILHGSATELLDHVKPGKWGAVCSWELLEHLTEREIDMALDGMVKALHPGGMMWHRIALETEGDPKFDGRPVNNAHDDETHATIQTEEWWRDKFSDLGLYHYESAEAALSRAFEDRDWWGRFFVYGKPILAVE